MTADVMLQKHTFTGSFLMQILKYACNFMVLLF